MVWARIFCHGAAKLRFTGLECKVNTEYCIDGVLKSSNKQDAKGLPELRLRLPLELGGTQGC